jgi:segregation and condensation protein B
MNHDNELKNALEAILLAAGKPVPTDLLLDLFYDSQRPTRDELIAALRALAADCEDRGIEVREVASGWRMQVRPRHAEIVSRLWQERPTRYSRALLETIALVAYRQPITRGEIEEIRGVGISTTIMRTLQDRNWIRVVGHREVPGRPELLGTTREFLDYFGLRGLEDLPTLAEVQDLEDLKVQLDLPEEYAPAIEATVPGTAVVTGASHVDVVADDEAHDYEAHDEPESTRDRDPDGGASTLVAAPPSGHER